VNGLAALPFHGNWLVEGWANQGDWSTYGGVPFNAIQAWGADLIAVSEAGQLGLTADRNAFIRSCEDRLALENSAWVGEWSQEKPPASQG